MSIAGFPKPESEKELSYLINLINTLPNFPKMNIEEQNNILHSLEAYECHGQVVKLLNWRLAKLSLNKELRFSDYLWMMHIQYLGLENFLEFVETVKRCVANLKLSFSIVKTHIAEQMLGQENYLEQSILYENIISHLPTSEDKVEAYEKLALIYEKKLFRENNVGSCYENILKLNQKNMTALRYYERIYRQNARWADDAELLLKLMAAAQNHRVKQRFAHELAGIYLHHLKRPHDAREIIIKYCQDSPIDNFEILIETLERMELYDEILENLAKRSTVVTDKVQLAFIKLKEGDIYRKTQHPKEALNCFRQSVTIYPEFLLGYEALFSILMDFQENEELLQIMEQFNQQLHSQNSQKIVGGFINRLKALKEGVFLSHQ